MKRLHPGVVMAAALLGAAPAGAQPADAVGRGLSAPLRVQYRFPDPTILVGPGATIGVRVRDLTSDDVQKAKLQTADGVFVTAVDPDRPAEKAGIKTGDVVVEFDGERVRSVRSLSRLVSETPPERTVTAVIVRDGARQTLSVTPESGRRVEAFRIQPNEPFLRPFSRPLPQRSPQGILRYRGYIGVTLTEISGQMAEYFGASAGALVSAVDLGSPASRAGLRAGDVITSAGGQSVSSPADVSAAVRAARPGSQLELKVVRDKKEVTISVDVPIGMPMLL